MEVTDDRVVTGGGHYGYIEDHAHGGASTPDTVPPAVPAVGPAKGSHTGQRGNLASVETAQSRPLGYEAMSLPRQLARSSRARAIPPHTYQPFR